MFKKFPKVILHVILGQYNPLKSPLHYQQSMLKRLYSPKILNKIALPENGLISIFFEVGMFKKSPKCHISCNFGQLWEHTTHLRASYYQEAFLRAHLLPKVFLNQYYQKLDCFLSCLKQKVRKMPKMSYFYAILASFGTI